jgi:ABC-2 type transport system permease protein
VASSTLGVWRSRNVLRYLVRRDLAVKYQQNVMGYLWSLLEPIGIGIIYYFVFIVVIGRGGRLAMVMDEQHYILYLMAGIFSYMWTAGVIGQSTNALSGQKSLITTMNVPREIFPVSKVFARSAEFLVGLPILVGIAALVGVDFTWWLLVIPLALAVQGTFLIGVALILSSLNVMMRDIERFMSMISRLIFYSSPILYPLAMVEMAEEDGAVPSWLVTIYKANPLVGIVELHHAVWFPGMFPSTALLITCLTGCLITLGAGWWLFRRLEPAVLKEL